MILAAKACPFPLLLSLHHPDFSRLALPLSKCILFCLLAKIRSPYSTVPYSRYIRSYLTVGEFLGEKKSPSLRKFCKYANSRPLSGFRALVSAERAQTANTYTEWPERLTATRQPSGRNLAEKGRDKGKKIRSKLSEYDIN